MGFTTDYIYLGFPASRWAGDAFLLLHAFLLFISLQYTALLFQQLRGTVKYQLNCVGQDPISRTKGFVSKSDVGQGHIPRHQSDLDMCFRGPCSIFPGQVLMAMLVFPSAV